MTATSLGTDPTSLPASAPSTESARKRRHIAPDKRRSNVLTGIIWLTALYFIIPLLWLVISSTKDNTNLFTSFGLWFGNTFEFFQNIGNVFTFQDGIYLHWLLNTALYAVAGSIGAAALATMAGYALAKYRFPGSGAVFNVVLGSIMVPMTALALPTYLLFANAGLTDTVWAIILPSLVSPFGVYLLRVYAADAVDDSLMEAARIDGAGELRIFRTISIRLLTPGIVTVLLFQLVATWNNYFLPLIMLNSPRLFPVTVGLAQWQNSASAGGGGQVLFSTVITGSFVSIIPLMIAFLFLQRFWQSGLSTGGVKG